MVDFVVKETNRHTEEDESVNANVCCVLCARCISACVCVCVWVDVSVLPQSINNTLCNNTFERVVSCDWRMMTRFMRSD